MHDAAVCSGGVPAGSGNRCGSIRDAVIIGFIANELISIVENAGLMGIPLPAVIANAIDILTQKAEKKGDA